MTVIKKPSLNDFLNNLPDNVVDRIMFIRSRVSAGDTDFGMIEGVFKFTKIGYKEYAIKDLRRNDEDAILYWHTEPHSGSIDIKSVSMHLSGTKVFLGEDTPTFDWD